VPGGTAGLAPTWANIVGLVGTVGGSLEIQSNPGSGTIVAGSIPLEG
jgi:hypothetical protein